MAPLASIPEANNSLHSTFDTHRPRSRVVFLSRRPGRSRCSVRRSPFANRFQYKPPEDAGHRGNPQTKHRQDPGKSRSPSISSKPRASPTWTRTSSDVTPDLRRLPHKSESPFDLDSFPEPPSANAIMQPVSNNNRHVATHPSNKHTAPKPPLALAQRKLLVPAQHGPVNVRHSLMDAAADVVNPLKRQSVDSVLVAAVSRSLTQQFRLVSKYSSRNSSQNDAASRTSSQRKALNRFTRDLEIYAQETSAKGKIMHGTPTPPADAPTLHTVSDFLPYRPQLRAAGLAVTSKEQGQGVPHYLKQLQQGFPLSTLRRQRRRKHGQPAQLDGYNGSGPSQSTETEISFAQTQDMDEFRYALIDEVPVRQKKHRPRIRIKRSTRHCLPCFPAEDDFTTDTDWAHFRVPSAKPKVLQKKPLKEPKQNVPFKSDAPRTCVPKDVSSAAHSPYQKPSLQEIKPAVIQDPPYQWDRPNFITTGRRHSMTVPKPKPRKEVCQVGQQHKNGRDSQDQIGKDPRAVPNLIKVYGQIETSNSSQVERPSQIGAQPSLPAKPSHSNRGQQAATAYDSQTNEQRGRKIDAEPRHRVQRPLRPVRSKKKPVPEYDPYHIGICCPKSRGVPAKLTARPNIPRRTSSIQGSNDSLDVDFDDREISDRDVLRGLHVAASAACNEEIDAFVRNKTGLRIRRFLADLMALETLTAVRPGEDGEQHARRRRLEMRKLKQQVRRSREVFMAGGLI